MTSTSFPSMLRRLATVFVVAAWLVACGGGVDSGGTGNGMESTFASGPITGLGSVIVNGVRYDDSAALIQNDDGAVRGMADLKLGMLAEIVASTPTASAGGGFHATASSVRFSSQLVGRVQAINGTAKQLTVLGQAVRVTAETVFDSALAGGLAALSVGDSVEVFAQLDTTDAAYVYVATRIQPAASVATYKLTGVIGSLSLADKTVTCGSQVISYADVAPADPATALAPGRLVRMRLASSVVAGTWQATAIDALDREVADRDVAEVQGRIGAFESVQHFTLNGIPVDASAATFPNGQAGVVLGARVEVEGRIRAGTLIARSVTVDAENEGEDPEAFELHGSISAANAPGRSFVVRGYTVTYTSSTRFDSSQASDIANGRQVEVHGALSSDGTRIEASLIHVER